MQRGIVVVVSFAVFLVAAAKPTIPYLSASIAASIVDDKGKDTGTALFVLECEPTSSETHCALATSVFVPTGDILSGASRIRCQPEEGIKLTDWRTFKGQNGPMKGRSLEVKPSDQGVTVETWFSEGPCGSTSKMILTFGFSTAGSGGDKVLTSFSGQITRSNDEAVMAHLVPLRENNARQVNLPTLPE